LCILEQSYFWGSLQYFDAFMFINAFYEHKNPIFFINLVRYYPCGEARVNRAQSRYGVELNVLSPNTTIVTKRTLSRKQKEFAMTNKTWITGFSRIGENRELKKVDHAGV